jgi:hypothetical protein
MTQLATAGANARRAEAKQGGRLRQRDHDVSSGQRGLLQAK